MQRIIILSYILHCDILNVIKFISAALGSIKKRAHFQFFEARLPLFILPAVIVIAVTVIAQVSPL